MYRWAVVGVVVGLRKVAGDFNSLRILGNVSLRVGGNRVIDVMNPDKTNGAALLRVVKALSRPSTNGIRVSKAMIDQVGRGRLSTFHGGGVNFIFRFRRLLPRFATLRGIVVPTFVTKMSSGRTGRRTVEVLSFVKLTRHTSRGPGRLSKKRGRHITITHTLVGSPTMVLTSRPSNDLSARGGRSLRRLFFSLERHLKRAFIVIARSRKLSGVASQAVRVISNVVGGSWWRGSASGGTCRGNEALRIFCLLTVCL